jgi:hypothetical protein
MTDTNHDGTIDKSELSQLQKMIKNVSQVIKYDEARNV